MKNQILKILKEIEKKSGGHNGKTLIELSIELKCDTDKLRQILNELYKDKLIATCLGINGVIIKIKNE